MPNKETFSIRPIRELIDKYREEGMVIVDPFARNSDIGTITNDLDPETKAMYHKDATNRVQPPIPVLYRIAEILNVDVRTLLVPNEIKK